MECIVSKIASIISNWENGNLTIASHKIRTLTKSQLCEMLIDWDKYRPEWSNLSDTRFDFEVFVQRSIDEELTH